MLVNVPDPARYAWHKPLISQRRRQPEKVPKDVPQAQTLLDVLLEQAPDDVSDMFEEPAAPGRRRWQDLAQQGLARLDPQVRDAVRARIGWVPPG